MIKKENGIALIQILIITAILSVFALYLTQTAKQQINMAMMAQDKAASELAIHSAEAELLFHLLTSDKLQESTDSEEVSVASKWNFYNTPFAINDRVMITIQDQATLMNLHSVHKGRVKKLFNYLGINEQRSEEILDRLFDWQDVDSITRPLGRETSAASFLVRNGPVPDVTEVKHILSLTDAEMRVFTDYFTIFFFGDFNPMLANAAMIEALSNSEAAAQVMLLRSNHQLSKSNFIKITGIEEEDDMSFRASNVLKILFDAKIESANVKKEIVVSLSPYSKESYGPINMLSDRK